MPNRRFDDPRSPLQCGHDEVASHRVSKNSISPAAFAIPD